MEESHKRGRVQYIINNYGANVARYDDDDMGFTCKCGAHVPLTNNKYKKNCDDHFNSSRCRRARRHQSSITSFFSPSQTYARPDPNIFCRGLWQQHVSVNGVQCDTSLLGEYAAEKVYYISTRKVQLQNSATREKQTVDRCVSQCFASDS